MSRVVTQNSNRLYESTMNVVYRSMLQGQEASRQTAPFTIGTSVDWTIPEKNAYDFARTYSFDLVTGINETTSRDLRGALQAWINEGGTLDDLADSIRPIFANSPITERIERIFSVDRARMIAETEATRAYAQGKVDGYMAQGLATAGPEIVPPLHVRCRCDVRMDRDDSTGIWYWVIRTAKDDLICPICLPYVASPRVGVAREAEVPQTGESAEPGTPEQQMNKKIEEAEKKISQLKTHEEAYVFTLDGSQILHKVGGLDYVEFTTGEISKFEGAILTHNHPSRGGSFSFEDINLMFRSRLHAIRATGTHEGQWMRFVMRPNNAARLIAETGPELREWYNQANAKVYEAQWEAIRSGKITIEQASHLHAHKVWSIVADNFKAEGANLGYKQEK